MAGMSDTILLKKRTAVITGGGTGFGFAAARALYEVGADVVLCGRRSGKLASAVARLSRTDFPGDVYSTSVDVTDDASVRQLVDTVLERYGKIDILINNAALIPRAATWEDTEFDTIDQVLATNLRGPILVTKAFLPAMRKHDYGRIINITSGLGWKTVPGYGAYSVSKAGLNSFTRTLAAELSGWNILVNAIDPGVAQTEQNPAAKDSPDKIVPGILRLASLPMGGPSGRIFRKDGETEAV